MAKGGSQTTTSRPDPLTYDMMRQIFGSALGAAGMPGTPPQQVSGGGGGIMGAIGRGRNNMGIVQPIGPEAAPVPGMSDLSKQAITGYQNASALGNLGIGALGGDQSAIDSFYNPYQRNVLDQLGSKYGDLRATRANEVNSAVMQSGAFGGARHGIAMGQEMSDLNRNQMQQTGALQYQGFNDAMGRAGGAANLGMGANQALNGMGEYERQIQMSQDPAMRRLQILMSVMGGGMPQGQSVTSPVAGGNRLGGALGGAATGSVFGPWGAGIGGLIGLLGA